MYSAAYELQAKNYLNEEIKQNKAKQKQLFFYQKMSLQSTG